MKRPFFKTSVGIFLLGMMIAEIMPSVVDPIHFYLQSYINTHTLSKGMFLFLQAFDWYLLEFIFILLLITIAWILHIKKVDTVKNIITISSILGVSALVGVIWWIVHNGGLG